MLALGTLLVLQTAQLSPFEMKKAETLLRDKLPCLGCHEVGGDGGRIGPSLSNLSGRDVGFIRRMIVDPAGTVPSTIMPRVPLDSATTLLVARYLVQRPPTPPARRLRAPSIPAAASQPEDRDAALYRRSCAPCHGVRGDGNGYNAPYLPVRPTAHRSATEMSRRSDAALYDAITGGGLIMGRSPRMPPFGATFQPTQILGLVRYLRALCACQGPAWSRDGR